MVDAGFPLETGGTVLVVAKDSRHGIYEIPEERTALLRSEMRAGAEGQATAAIPPACEPVQAAEHGYLCPPTSKVFKIIRMNFLDGPRTEFIVIRVDRSHTDAVRTLLKARVRLQVQESRRWFFWTTFTVVGPPDAVEAARRELDEWEHDRWLDRQP